MSPLLLVLIGCNLIANGSSFILIPEELTTILNLLYSRIPPTRIEFSRKARSLEVELDVKLTALSKLCAANDHLPRHSSVTEPLLPKEDLVGSSSLEIQDLLDELQKMNDQLEGCLVPEGLTSIQLHTLQRHREILEDYSADFTRIKDNFKHQKQKEELFRSDQDDSNRGSYSRRMELYMKEHDHLQSSSRLVDDQISIALETRDQLHSQRLNLKRLQTRLHDVASRFPLLNSLVQRINFRKRRDSIILGIVVFICTIFLLTYAFH